MLKVAFCDDEVQMLNSLAALTDQYRLSRNSEIEYQMFCSPLELLSDLEKGKRYDALFLDILMPGENGIDAAREIRDLDQAVKIIFLTSTADYAVQSYSVGAYYYQPKPIRKDVLFRLLDSVAEECRKQEQDCLIVKSKGGVMRVDISRLIYCEAMGRGVLLHLANGQVIESSGGFGGLSDRLLSRGGFLRSHRSYLVNMDYIQNISRRTISLTNMEELPIPSGKFAEIRDAYLEYTCRSGGFET